MASDKKDKKYPEKFDDNDPDCKGDCSRCVVRSICDLGDVYLGDDDDEDWEDWEDWEDDDYFDGHDYSDSACGDTYGSGGFECQ